MPCVCLPYQQHGEDEGRQHDVEAEDHALIPQIPAGQGPEDVGQAAAQRGADDVAKHLVHDQHHATAACGQSQREVRLLRRGENNS